MSGYKHYKAAISGPFGIAEKVKEFRKNERKRRNKRRK